MLRERLTRGGGVWQILRFGLVGGAATLTDLSVSVFLLYVLHLHENAVTTLAFAVAFVVSYCGHRSFTFHKAGSALRFLGVALSMLVLRNLIVALLLSMGLSGLLPLIIAMALVTVLTYMASKTLVFKGPER